jgi:hypothetical protein
MEGTSFALRMSIHQKNSRAIGIPIRQAHFNEQVVSKSSYCENELIVKVVVAVFEPTFLDLRNVTACENIFDEKLPNGCWCQTL